MCPEYGATAALFPVDDHTLRYLEISNREPEHIRLVDGTARNRDSSAPMGCPSLSLASW